MDLQGDEGLARARGGPSVITPGFEDVWPDVDRRLRALLFRRGLDQSSADDVVQEVALRVLAHGVTYESAGDLLRWAAPVACRLHVDLLRHRARLTDPDDAAEHPARDDVAGEVADRLELQRALRAIATLRPADRAAIIDAVAAEPSVPRDRQEAVRLAVRRHRARNRLAVVLEQLAAWVTGLFAGSRLLVRGERRGPAIAALVPAAVAIPFMVTFGPAAPTPTPTRPPAAVAPAESGEEPRATNVAARSAIRPADVKSVAPEGRRTTRPVTTARPAPKQAVDVDGPGGIGVRAGTDQRRPDDRLACLNNVPAVGRVCL